MVVVTLPAVSFIGVIANLLNIRVFSRHKTSGSQFLMALSCSDLGEFLRGFSQTRVFSFFQEAPPFTPPTSQSTFARCLSFRTRFPSNSNFASDARGKRRRGEGRNLAPPRFVWALGYESRRGRERRLCEGKKAVFELGGLENKSIPRRRPSKGKTRFQESARRVSW